MILLRRDAGLWETEVHVSQTGQVNHLTENQNPSADVALARDWHSPTQPSQIVRNDAPLDDVAHASSIEGLMTMNRKREAELDEQSNILLQVCIPLSQRNVYDNI